MKLKMIILISYISCLLIISSSHPQDVLKVNVTQMFYEAQENNNITLEWTFPIQPDKSVSVSCYQTFIDGRMFVVFQYMLRVDDGSEDDRFAGRVHCDADVLRTGWIRLELSNLRTNDSGFYMCNVNTDYGHGSDRCRLNVSAADRPQPPNPNPDSGRWISLGIGLSVVAVVVLIVFGVWRKRNGSDVKLRILWSSDIRNYGSQSEETGLQTFMGASAASSPSTAEQTSEL